MVAFIVAGLGLIRSAASGTHTPTARQSTFDPATYSGVMRVVEFVSLITRSPGCAVAWEQVSIVSGTPYRADSAACGQQRGIKSSLVKYIW